MAKKRATKGEQAAAKARFDFYWKTRIASDSAWPEVEQSTREACAMSASECETMAGERDRLFQLLREDSAQRERNEPCLSQDDHRKMEDEKERLNDAVIAWEIGEELRKRKLWFEEGLKRAKEIIAGRKSEQSKEVRFDDFAVGDGKGDAALLLPVVYEMFRQSERCLQWAILYHSVGGLESHRQGIEMSMMDRAAAEDMQTQWQRQIGRGWVNAIACLVEYLARDAPFSEIPAERRTSVAELAERASDQNTAISMDFELVDGGGVAFEPFMRMIGRQTVRLAHHREATQEGAINIFHLKEEDGTRKPPEQYVYRDALKASCDEHIEAGLFYEFEGKPYRSFSDIEKVMEELEKAGQSFGMVKAKRAFKGTSKHRYIDDSGAEIIALRVNWSGTRNAELGKALAALAERIRPQEWPEAKAQQGNRTKDAKAALRALIMVLNSKGQALRSKDRELALKWYRGITGDKRLPWWERGLKSK